jgi:hypothetical protein
MVRCHRKQKESQQAESRYAPASGAALKPYDYGKNIRNKKEEATK